MVEANDLWVFMFLQRLGIWSYAVFLGVAIGSCRCWAAALFMVPLALSEAEASMVTEGSLVESFCRPASGRKEWRGERAERGCGNTLEGLCVCQQSVSR